VRALRASSPPGPARRDEVGTKSTRSVVSRPATVGPWRRRGACWRGWSGSRRSTAGVRRRPTCSPSCRPCSRRRMPGRGPSTRSRTRRSTQWTAAGTCSAAGNDLQPARNHPQPAENDPQLAGNDAQPVGKRRAEFQQDSASLSRKTARHHVGPTGHRAPAAPGDPL
jgi:hypothetical protein